MGLPVNPPDMKPAAVFCDETNGLTTTIVRKSVHWWRVVCRAWAIRLNGFCAYGKVPVRVF